MSKIISKKNFFEKLEFYLSFYFSDEEYVDILNDYEEWFENEILLGKSEKEICLSLEEPKKIAKKLYSELGDNSNGLACFIKNDMLKILVFVITHFLINFFLLELCSKSGLNYLYFAIGIDFVYFGACMKIIKKSTKVKHYDYKNNFMIMGLMLLLLLIELLIFPKLSYWYSGKICVSVICILLIIIFSINIYLSLKKFNQDKSHILLIIFHLSGVTTILFFLINQIHMFYNNITEYYMQLVMNSILIYTVVVVLCVVLFKYKVCSKERK